MNAQIKAALLKFNDRQKMTLRKPLMMAEIEMISKLVRAEIATDLAEIRNDIETMSSETEADLRSQLDFATDVIVHLLKEGGTEEHHAPLEQVRKDAENATLLIEDEEGKLILRVVKTQ